jgi:predicted ATP-grasp superfamily ATP-dependent carboligase
MRILLFSIDETRLGMPRLPKGLQQAGFEVGVLCSDQNLLAKTQFIDQKFYFSPTKSSQKLLNQLVQVIQQWKPMLIVPGDETVVAFLHDLIRKSHSQPGLLSKEVEQVLLRSFGDPQWFDATIIKDKTQQIAATLNIRTPASVKVTHQAEALQGAEKIGYPIVLKKDFSWSGDGVKVCSDEQALLQSLPTFLPKSSFALKERLRGLLHREWLPTNKVLSLQQFIKGRPAMYALVALRGKVLAGYSAIPERTTSATGPSSVVRFVNNAEMTAMSTQLVERFGYSGFCGFDFMIEETTGKAYLLECNPRPIPICHLGSKVGIDLGKALFEGLQGHSPAKFSGIVQEEVIALFPQEWKRDPSSPYLAHNNHDVPWDDPLLLSAIVGQANLSKANWVPCPIPDAKRQTVVVGETAQSM